MPSRYVPITLWSVAAVLSQYELWRQRYYVRRYRHRLYQAIRTRVNRRRHHSSSAA